MTLVAEVPSKKDYIRQLTPYAAFITSLQAAPAFEIVNITDLATVGSLPGKTGACIVTKSGSGLVPASNFVFKGVDYDQYIKDGRDFQEHQEKTLLHEIRTLCTIPPHPNIMPRPSTLVVIRDDGVDYVCGFLQPVMEKNSVDEQVMRANAQNRRLPPVLKAKWCFQMALAIRHTHRAADSYHMDLKPGNMLVDDDDNVRLIDWEQSGVSMFTHPPEVTIDQHAEEEVGTGKIVYTPRGDGEAPRKNQKWGFPDWDVFPEWKQTCPRAAEQAEVFSLGRTMWMLLEQVEQSADPAVWTEAAVDVPETWKEMVRECLKLDPNDRPGLDDVVDFWREQMESA